MTKMRHVVLGAFAAAALTIGAGIAPAAADAIYSINVGNTALTGFTGPYASLDISLTSSTTATATFTSQTNGGYLYLMGGAGAADVNVNAASFSISSLFITNSLSGFNAPSLSDGGSGNVDGFGVFNQTTKAFDGFASAGTTVSFTLTNTSGTWASAGDVLVADNKGNFAAVHAFACAVTCTKAEGAAVTGFAANKDGPVFVPEPGSLALLGTALLGLGLFARRRHRG